MTEPSEAALKVWRDAEDAKRKAIGDGLRSRNGLTYGEMVEVGEVAAALVIDRAMVAGEPVAWQRRYKYTTLNDPPGKVYQWEACSHDEATSHFDRRAGYEYRALYTHPAPDTAALVSALDPEAIREHADRLVERMRNTPFGPKRKLLAAQHIEQANRAHYAEGWNAALIAQHKGTGHG